MNNNEQLTIDGVMSVVSKQELEALRREYSERILPSLSKDRDRCVCANCGLSDGQIEFHHIVPLIRGGTNRMTNIVPLCHECHWCVHSYHPHDRTKHIKFNAGRPRKEYTDKQKNDISLYLQCVIGKKELMRRAGITDHRISSNWMLKQIANELGIVEHRNNIDIWLQKNKGKGGLQVGKVLGYVVYNNGKRITYRYMCQPDIEGGDDL